MSYGFKRWSLGYGCGAASMAAPYFSDRAPSVAIACFGLSIMLFFADYLVADKR